VGDAEEDGEEGWEMHCQARIWGGRLEDVKIV
jgi:hypothetical protein